MIIQTSNERLVPISYSGGPRFTPRPVGWQFWEIFFMVSLKRCITWSQVTITSFYILSNQLFIEYRIVELYVDSATENFVK
jgi:hypothetical protein